ncbi:UTP--glucose-1-phosphate uridylyltransferase GalU [Salinicoccus sp. ID82-1]|uniref:UTP--glucose-1-phosphate uridylyltransferase GalU n=1 Tax=Salinicoccus sp. ID82-1 TaxID=2820269 RepID=UPI001F009291|nr:UTP--glucose-1-phosphate uridylyltransferase GalU [Salinicoccus sp. ID82-1]MCG1010009.1 UTP--glucose-1-phosphate uridylyltransferase GalU [Salinicoccus sp. ID82-1]
MKKVRKAVIPADGLGTRFLPATKAMPKEMLPIMDKPTIQYIVEEAVAAGIEDIIIVTGKHKRAIEDHFDHQIELEMNLKRKEKYELLEKVEHATGLANIFYVRQKSPKGLGHAIHTAKQFIGDEPFAVLLGDDIVDNGEGTPAIGQLMAQYDQCQSPIIGVKQVPKAQTSRYGIVEFDEKKGNLYHLSNMYEKPEPGVTDSTLAIMGRYVLTPEVFKHLEAGRVGAGGEIQLTDAIHAVIQSGGDVHAVDFEGRRHDVGDKTGFVKTTIEYALKSDMRETLLDFMEETLKKNGR